MLLGIADSLQHNSVIDYLTSTGWTAALLAIFHYYSMFVLVGSMTVVNLSVLGVVARQQGPSVMARRLFPWVWTSLILNLASGFVLFAADATDYLPTWPFRLKMFVVLLAIAFSVVVQRATTVSENVPTVPKIVKVLAGISIVLWVGAILMGVEVPVLSGIG